MLEQITLFKNGEFYQAIRRSTKMEKMPDAVMEIEQMQKEGSFLRMPYSDISIKLKKWYEHSEGLSTGDPKDASVEQQRNSCVIGVPGQYLKQEPLVITTSQDGEQKDTEYSIHIDLFHEGWVIYVGKDAPLGLFGVKTKNYINKMSSRQGRFHMTRSGKSAAKTFANAAAVKKFCQKYADALIAFGAQEGFTYSMEPASKMFAEYLAGYPDKNEAAAKEELANINESIQPSEIQWPEIPDEVNADVIRSEAVTRMQYFKMISETTKAFKAGKLMYSEGAGILYDLDQECENAIQDLKEKWPEMTPFHLIKTHTADFGTVVSILVVTDSVEDWDNERPDRDGICFAYVYNTSEPMFSELGDIQVEPVNGGLMRTA